jgi:UDPglucose 6-dehydrogenase
MKKISMIGCGKLGKDCAEVMAEKYDIVGYDIVNQNPLNFSMVNSIEKAVLGKDIIFIAVPTPHENEYDGSNPTSHLPNKDFDYSAVTNVLKQVNQYANKNQLVVLISTVLPGTVRTHLIKHITNARFVYNPYLIAMGTVKWDMVNPEMIIIGTEDGSVTTDAAELINFYQPLMKNNPRIEIGTWDEAESIKIFYNTFISAKLSLVNMIQDVAEANGNINVDVVTQALAKSTQRIMGPGYMKAGMGDGGACHPRDNIALRYMAEKLNLGYDLFNSIMTAREKQAERMAKKCLEIGNNVCIIGKAYKPGVHYTIGSSSMLVGHYIENNGGNLTYYDLNTGDANFTETDVYLIGYWEQWVEDIEFPVGCTVIDPWRQIAPSNKYTVIHYGNTR